MIGGLGTAHSLAVYLDLFVYNSWTLYLAIAEPAGPIRSAAHLAGQPQKAPAVPGSAAYRF